MILPRMLNADAEGVECDRDPKVDFCHCHPKERKKVRAISPLSLSSSFAAYESFTSGSYKHGTCEMKVFQIS